MRGDINTLEFRIILNLPALGCPPHADSNHYRHGQVVCFLAGYRVSVASGLADCRENFVGYPPLKLFRSLLFGTENKAI